MKANPAHPGEFIRDEILPAFGVTITKAVEILGVSRPGFNNMLNCHRALTPEMAMKIEAAFGVSANLLMGLQSNYDLAQARQRADEIVGGIKRQKMLEGR